MVYIPHLEYRNDFLLASQCEICPTFTNFDVKQPLSDLKILETDLKNLLSNQLHVNALERQSFDVSDAEGESIADPATSHTNGFDYDDDPNEEPLVSAFSGSHDRRRKSLLFSLKTSAKNQFSYFDESAMKNWAGPQHWKVRLHYKPPAKQDGKRAPKKINYIDFLLAEPVDPSQLFVKSNTPTILSKTVLETRLFQTNLLPEDLKYSTKNLLSLFTKPDWGFQLSDDGHLSLSIKEPMANGGSLLIPPEEAFHEYSSNYPVTSRTDSFGDMAEDDGAGFEDVLQHAEQEDTEIGNNLVSEPKMTKMLKMNYARVAKRVDLKLLKENIWKEIEADSVPLVKFSDVISNLAKYYKPEQARELSVSYCFISLLHLANEKHLNMAVVNGELNISPAK
jgi:condensin complex subunit 2